MSLIRLLAISLFLQQVVKLPEEAEEDETTTEVSSPSGGDTVEEVETGDQGDGCQCRGNSPEG